eukprot:COSAG02_NODE_14356_length_1280_cov_24.558848_2_plen_141_part_00
MVKGATHHTSRPPHTSTTTSPPAPAPLPSHSLFDCRLYSHGWHSFEPRAHLFHFSTEAIRESRSNFTGPTTSQMAVLRIPPPGGVSASAEIQCDRITHLHLGDHFRLVAPMPLWVRPQTAEGEPTLQTRTHATPPLYRGF